ncbi:hypothetical protein PYCC9005_001500 [Savitreella phatthalungensis]
MSSMLSRDDVSLVAAGLSSSEQPMLREHKLTEDQSTLTIYEELVESNVAVLPDEEKGKPDLKSDEDLWLAGMLDLEFDIPIEQGASSCSDGSSYFLSPSSPSSASMTACSSSISDSSVKLTDGTLSISGNHDESDKPSTSLVPSSPSFSIWQAGDPHLANQPVGPYLNLVSSANDSSHFERSQKSKSGFPLDDDQHKTTVKEDVNGVNDKTLRDTSRHASSAETLVSKASILAETRCAHRLSDIDTNGVSNCSSRADTTTITTTASADSIHSGISLADVSRLRGRPDIVIPRTSLIRLQQKLPSPVKESPGGLDLSQTTITNSTAAPPLPPAVQPPNRPGPFASITRSLTLVPASYMSRSSATSMPIIPEQQASAQHTFARIDTSIAASNTDLVSASPATASSLQDELSALASFVDPAQLDPSSSPADMSMRLSRSFTTMDAPSAGQHLYGIPMKQQPQQQLRPQHVMQNAGYHRATQQQLSSPVSLASADDASQLWTPETSPHFAPYGHDLMLQTEAMRRTQSTPFFPATSEPTHPFEASAGDDFFSELTASMSRSGSIVPASDNGIYGMNGDYLLPSAPIEQHPSVAQRAMRPSMKRKTRPIPISTTLRYPAASPLGVKTAPLPYTIPSPLSAKRTFDDFSDLELDMQQHVAQQPHSPAAMQHPPAHLLETPTMKRVKSVSGASSVLSSPLDGDIWAAAAGLDPDAILASPTYPSEYGVLDQHIVPLSPTIADMGYMQDAIHMDAVYGPTSAALAPTSVGFMAPRILAYDDVQQPFAVPMQQQQQPVLPQQQQRMHFALHPPQQHIPVRRSSSYARSPARRPFNNGPVSSKEISFCNFTAADKKTILSGVAPSGSNKKHTSGTGAGNPAIGKVRGEDMIRSRSSGSILA